MRRPIVAGETYLSVCVSEFFIFIYFLDAHKHRQTVQHSSTGHAVHTPLSSEAWECTLSSLSLWWRLWCVADQAPESSGWDVSSFSDEGGSAPPSNYQVNISSSDRWLTEAPARFINI